MDDRKYIEIKQGAIRIRDPGTILAIGALRAGLVLHAGGIVAVLLIASFYQALNSWLILAAGLFAVGVVLSVCSLGSILHWYGNMNSGLRRAWDERTKGRLAVDELFPYVDPLYPKPLDPGPVFGWLSGLFLVGGCFGIAVGLARILWPMTRAL